MKSKSKGGKVDKGVVFKIDKGVAIPPQMAIGSLSASSRAMLDLEQGDSFLISDKKPATVMGAVRAMNRRMVKQKKNVVFTARRMADGVRVWRMK